MLSISVGKAHPAVSLSVSSPAGISTSGVSLGSSTGCSGVADTLVLADSWADSSGLEGVSSSGVSPLEGSSAGGSSADGSSGAGVEGVPALAPSQTGGPGITSVQLVDKILTSPKVQTYIDQEATFVRCRHRT